MCVQQAKLANVSCKPSGLLRDAGVEWFLHVPPACYHAGLFTYRKLTMHVLMEALSLQHFQQLEPPVGL